MERRNLLLVLAVERNKEKNEKEKEKEGEEGKKIPVVLPLIFDNLTVETYQTNKSIYSTRTTLQGVGIPPSLVYFHPKGYLAEFL